MNLPMAEDTQKGIHSYIKFLLRIYIENINHKTIQLQILNYIFLKSDLKNKSIRVYFHGTILCSNEI